MPVIREDGTIAHPTSPEAGAVAPAVGGQVARIGGAPQERALFSVFGDVKRQGRWTVAAQTRSVTVFGDTVLDLRDASFEEQKVEVRAFVLFGDLKVIVPAGVDVRVRAGLVFGDQKVQRRTEPGAGAPLVDIDVYGGFGDVKVLELEPGEVEPKWYDRFRRDRS